MQYLSLGQKLRLKRKEQDLTLKDIAGDYISPATLSLVERDMQTPSEELLRYLADQLQTPFHYFRETPEETLNRRAKSLLAEAETLLFRKRFRMATRYAEEIMQDASALKLTDLVGQSCLLLSRIYLEQENYHKANEYLFDAQSSALLSGHHEWLPNIYYHFGLVSFRQGFYAQALDYFKKAEHSEPETVEDDLTRQILSMLSQTYHKLNQFDLALQFAERTKELVSRMNHLEAYAESLIVLGTSYREKGQYDRAQELFQEALRLIHQIDAKQELAEVEHNLASLFVKTGDKEQANKHFANAIEQKQALGDRTVVATTLEYVETLIEQQDLETAKVHLEQALELLERFSVEEERARALALRYQLLALEGKEQQSKEALQESLQLTRRLPVPKRLADTLVRLGRICISSGDVATATLLFAEALTVYEKLGVILDNFT